MHMADEQSDSLRTLTAAVLAFRDMRDWRQFHSPRNLAAALAIEAAELQETLLWKSDEQVASALKNEDQHQKVSDEIADVLIFALLFADAAGVDAASSIRNKLLKNEIKYPVERARGSALKYTEFEPQ
jgi:NTP pyrophosphatase (non-canonical NTP hydrolase)